MHVFVQMVCALVKPTIMARKMVRARRGTDSKRPAEPRRAERRHDREAAREHIGTIVLVHCWFRFCIVSASGTIVLGFFRFSKRVAHFPRGDWRRFRRLLHHVAQRVVSAPAGLYEYAGVGYEQSDTVFAGAVP